MAHTPAVEHLQIPCCLLPSLSFHALRDQLNRWRFSSFYQPMVPPTPATQQSLLSMQNAKAWTRVTKTAEWV